MLITYLQNHRKHLTVSNVANVPTNAKYRTTIKAIVALSKTSMGNSYVMVGHRKWVYCDGTTTLYQQTVSHGGSALDVPV